MRARGGRGIADQRDTPEHKLRRHKIVDRREERPRIVEAVENLRREGLLRTPRDPWDDVLANERRRHGVLVLVPLLVDAYLAQFLRITDPIPADVIAAMADAQVVVQSGDRIAKDVLPSGNKEDEVGENARSGLGLEV